ncbi:hypothetical protein PCHDK_000558800, partial [Plasmodium chabaudi adami]
EGENEESSAIEPKNNKFTSSFFPSSFFNPDEPIIASKLFGLSNTEKNIVDAPVKHKNPFEITKDNLNTKKINNNTVEKTDKQIIKEVKNDSRKRKNSIIFDESTPESIKKFKYSNNYMNINNVIEKNNDQAAQHEEEKRQKILKETQRAKIYGSIIKKNCRLMSYGQNKDYNYVPKESNKKRVRFQDKVTIIPNLPPKESSAIEPKNNKFTSSFFPSSFFNPDEPIIASKLFGLSNTEKNIVDAPVKHKNPFEITKDNLNTKKINNNTVEKTDKQIIKEVKNDSRKRKNSIIFDESTPESIKKFKYSNNYMNINNVIEKNNDQAAQHEEEKRQKILKETQRAKIYGSIIKKNCRLMSYGQNKDYNYVPKESNKKRVRFQDK